MSELPEKSKRRPLTANEKQILRLLVVLIIGMVILFLGLLYTNKQSDNPFEMTSTAISLTNEPPVLLLTMIDTDMPRLTQTAEAFTPAPGN